MKRNVSPGTGLALLACAIMVHAVIDRDASRADAGMPAHARAPAAAAWAAGPIEPTIVWYGASTYTDNYSFQRPIAIRAWSDGRVEYKRIDPLASGGACGSGAGCSSPWFQISSFTEGAPAQSDLNLDARVDGADLGQLLNDWGDAPRHDIPPSDCPLALINP